MSNDSIKALKELYARKNEALRLYRCMPSQEPAYKSTARELLVRGGNRSGKTTICATMFAAIATDQPILTKDGEHIDCRYPHQKDRELLMWCIGYQQKHIGQTLYRVLFRPGMFSVIKDDDSEMWRPFDPERDAGRENEKRPSAPLIPERFIEPNSWAWESKSERVFTGVRIVEPITKKPLAQIYAYTSTGEPKTGDPVDAIWIDEHIAFENHYAEWQARLIDTKGRLFWSSWPRTSNMALRDLSKRAKEDAEKGIGRVREFVFKMRENPYLSKEAKDDALAGWTEDEKRARDSGEFLTDNLLIYPSFDKYVHAAIRDQNIREDDISRILRERNGDPPRDWTRELILDPGTQRPGVLFAAIPPPTLGDWLIVYDEIYIPRLNAEQLASVIKQKAQGQFFHRFVIDGHAARQKPMGFGHTVGEAYQRAFEKRGITCSQTGSMFIPGSDDFSSRSHLVQAALHIRNDGTPRLRFVTHKLPNLVDQMESNVKILQANDIKDKPDPHQKDDLRVCLEYWVSRNPTYEAPPLDEINSSPAFEYYQKFKERREAGEDDESEDDIVKIGQPESQVDDFVGAF